MRAQAQARFQATLEGPSRQVSNEFEGMMQALEAKRFANAERCARLREQIEMVDGQLATQRARGGGGGAARAAAPEDRAAARAGTVELARLKEWVRSVWSKQAVEAAARGGRAEVASLARSRVIFLSRALRLAPYTGPLKAALERKLLDLRAKAGARARAAAPENRQSGASSTISSTTERMALMSRLLSGGR